MVAPWILWRYLFRDTTLHLLLGLALFGVVLAAAGLLQRLDDLVAVGAGPGMLLRVSAIILPSYLTYAVSTALAFAVLAVLIRMSTDGEIVALGAAGVGVYRLVPPILTLALIISALSAYVAFELEPRSHYQMRALLRSALSSASLVEPGRVRNVSSGQTIYVDAIGDESCPLRGVLISNFRDPRRPYYLSASCGTISRKSEQSAGLSLDLRDGTLHLADADDETYHKADFTRGSLELDLTGILFHSKRPKQHTFFELMQPEVRERLGEEAVRSEVQRRLALPFAPLLLAMLALPLGIRPLRAGRSAGIIGAVLITALYWCTFTAGLAAVEAGLVPAWVGTWAPNGIAVVLALALLRRTAHGEY
jgi:lipopolysaccharide export system permease protein